MDLEGIMLSETSQRKTSIIQCHSYVEFFFKSNLLKKISKMVDTRGGEWKTDI